MNGIIHEWALHLGKIKLVKILPESFELKPMGLKRQNINEVSERQQNANNVSVGKRNTHIITDRPGVRPSAHYYNSLTDWTSVH